jgi:hypothetical protein
LDKSACSTQDEQQVLAFLEAMKKWQLTKAEKLQILNLRPKTPVELHIVSPHYTRFVFFTFIIATCKWPIYIFNCFKQLIEECEERYSGEQLEELLEVIMQVLPRDDDYVAEEEEQQQEEG